MNYIFELAKNGQYTCKVIEGNTSKYIYSKYNPSNITSNWDLQDDVKGYVLLGIGLGYEYIYLQQKISKPIYVIEPNEIFKKFIAENTNINPIYIDELIAGYQLLVNEQMYPFEKDLYRNVIQGMQNARQPKVVYMLEYGVIAKDCKLALEKMGFKVNWMTIDDFKIWVTNILEVPDYFFSINFQPWLSEVAEQLQVPYISWTVDTPSYSLFLSQNLKLNYSYMFHYDEKAAQKLKQHGLNNVYYLPMAVNTERLNKIINTTKTIDVSFLGNSCGHNEFETHIKQYLTQTDLEEIEKLILKQMKTSNFIIEQELSNQIIEKIITTPGLVLPDGLLDILSAREVVGLLIGRQHSFVERTTLVKILERKYDFKLYGNSYWKQFGFSSYNGHAEHFYQMPTIFKQSKININIIRSFVESGLPMRVFDVLGSGGFLLTNLKDDILKYFKDGEHLVVFNNFDDLQNKIDYYLQNEEERNLIAKKGYELVRQFHTFENRIEHMVEVLTQEGV